MPGSKGLVMTISIRRILLPTDFSEPAAEALRYAITLADQFGAELRLLHVVVPPVIPYPDSSTLWTMPDTGLIEQVKEAESRFSTEISSWGEERRVISAVTTGFAVEEIVKYAEDHVIDLIIIGTHGLTGLSHLLIGSVAEKLVRIATCPVLTVRPGGHPFLIEALQFTACSLA
jgi:universal stress protein A